MDRQRPLALLHLELSLIGLAIPLLLVLGVVVVVVMIAVSRSDRKGGGQGGGADVVAYLVLAVAMAVAGFALAELASTAFPGDRFVFDPAETLATSLAALIVSTPFVIYFWRRQADRRATYPASTGWAIYLTLMELVFMIAFVVTAVMTVNGMIGAGSISAWPRAVVFGLVVVFHELAARRTPPQSDAGELPRVIGSAIGLITASIGLYATLAHLLASLFSLPSDIGLEPWLAMVIVGAPVWGYRWLLPWPSAEPSVPREVWATMVSIGTVTLALGSATALIVILLQYLLGDVGDTTDHFDTVPIALGLIVPSLPIAWVHRRGGAMGAGRTNAVRVFEYALASIGLSAAVAAASALTVAAFDNDLIVGGGADQVILFATVLVAGLLLWGLMTRRTDRADIEEERSSWPRRFYHLGLGILFALISASALITTLVILFRMLIGGGEAGGLLAPSSIFVYAGLAAWYLLVGYGRDRETMRREEVIAPFDVTIITSHPGMIATKFPKQARLQVIHRGDQAGAIDEEMADEIVAAVGNQPSLVWVDAEGFRVAPRRISS